MHCASNRDKVCPRPNPSEQPNTDNQTVNIIESEKVDVQDHQLITQHCQADIKRGRQVNQGEVRDTMSVRKRRKAS